MVNPKMMTTTTNVSLNGFFSRLSSCLIDFPRRRRRLPAFLKVKSQQITSLLTSLFAFPFKRLSEPVEIYFISTNKVFFPVSLKKQK
jgi:hypothetical protein